MKQEWLKQIIEAARPAMVAFKECGNPDFWLYFAGSKSFADWFDGKELFGIPVSNVGQDMTLVQSVSQDEDCPLRPMWFGEEMESHNKARREFQLRFAKTGDF